MKTKAIVSLFALALSLTLAAADLKLNDGRTFTDFRVVSQTPTTVLVRYSGGAAKIQKKDLPADLLAQYPIDEAAAAAEAADIEKGKAIFDAQKKAVADKEAKAGARRAAAIERNQNAQASREQLAAINSAAASLPEKIFEAVRAAGNLFYHGYCTYEFEYPRAVAAKPGIWELHGVASLGSNKTNFTATIDATEGKPAVRDFKSEGALNPEVARIVAAKAAAKEQLRAEQEKSMTEEDRIRRVNIEAAARVRPEAIASSVRAAAAAYFKTLLSSGSRQRQFSFVLQDPKPVSGWANTFDVVGAAQSSSGRDSTHLWFTARVAIVVTEKGTERITVTDVSPLTGPPL